MASYNKAISKSNLRSDIAGRVRELRLGRRWTQAELAEKLGLSQSRLSEIEHGAGSFTAEQFLEILKLFNVTASSFTGPVDRRADLQNALARAGATNLLESEHLPSEELAQIRPLIREALIDGSARVITSIGPVFVRNAKLLNLKVLVADATDVGLDARLLWVLENLLFAINSLPRALPVHAPSLFAILTELDQRSPTGSQHEDILDSTIRTKTRLEKERARMSGPSRKWGIVTSLRPDDFAQALIQAGLG